MTNKMESESAGFQHSMKRRCFVHDYKGRSIYLITLEVSGRKPLLGKIVPCPDSPVEGLPLSVCGLNEAELKAVNAGLFVPTELGKRVTEEFLKIGEHVPGVKPLYVQAMPDHFHGILFVTQAIDRSLGSIMAGFKGKCSQLAREVLSANAPSSLWEPGYHDRILTTDGQLKAMIRYVLDNPRRAALRLLHRELFTGVRCLAMLFEAAKKGAVLCSPCISDGEKALAYEAVDAGYPLIVLRSEPFPPRFKPSGRFFDACAEGRLLMLCLRGLTAHAPHERITRAECLALNEIVARICGGPASDIVYQGTCVYKRTVCI